MAQRLWSLFRVERTKSGRKRYVPVSCTALPKTQAVLYFRSQLLSRAMGLETEARELRPLTAKQRGRWGLP